jgi:hypothetical protein
MGNVILTHTREDRTMTTKYEAYCLVCCGGGKTLTVGSKRAAERAATSHGNAYGHNVTILSR